MTSTMSCGQIRDKPELSGLVLEPQLLMLFGEVLETVGGGTYLEKRGQQEVCYP